MIPKNSKVVLIISSLVACILLVILGLAVYRIGRENNETSDLLQQADQAAEVERLSQSIRSIQTTQHDEIAAFQDVALTEDRLVVVIEGIESAARALSLDAKIVSVDKTGESATEPQKITIVIDSDGSWKGNFSLLRAIESLPYHISIENADLSKSGTSWHSHFTIVLLSFKS